MKRLLAISWEMPPIYGPRAAQVSRVLAELPALGWTPTVVSMDPKRGGPHWFEGAAAVPPSLNVVRVRSRQESFFIRSLWRVLPLLRDYPDTARPWIAPATRAAVALTGSATYDALISFAQPWSDHLVGQRVHRETRLPWVAHFSDPWTDSPYATERQRSIWSRMEAEIVREATALVFVTQETADLVMRKYPAAFRGKVAIVPHGFDADSSARPAPSPDPLRPLRMVYTGRFYRGIRTPVPFLNALAELNARTPLQQAIDVSFIGPHVEEFKRDAERLGVDTFVSFRERVSTDAAAAAAAAADVLLVIDAAANGASVFLPSKLVDYLAFRRPILGITPARGASASLLRRLNCPIAAPDDPHAIASAIEGVLTQWRAGTLRVDASFDRTAADFDIKHTSRLLADVLARACA